MITKIIVFIAYHLFIYKNEVKDIKIENLEEVNLFFKK